MKTNLANIIDGPI